VSVVSAAVALVAALVVGLLAGCSSDTAATPRTEGVAEIGSLPAPGPAIDDGAVVTTTTVAAGATDPVDTADLPGVTTTVVEQTVDSGVPGLDDESAMCAAWARFAGSTQLLAIASSFGELEPEELARIEVVAASVIRSAVADLDRLLPASVDDEHPAFIDRVVGPAARRATRAESYLTEAGADGPALQVIAAAWLETLRTHDPDEAVPDLPDLAPLVSASVDAAAVRFAADVTPFGQDPSLDTSAVSTPGIVALLADRCPDLTAYGVGDDI
jgi:hypothetical protein